MKTNQYLISVAAIVILAACSPKTENRGYIKQAELKEAVKIGQTSKQEVFDRFGSPSSESRLDGDKWYYISAKKEGIAFLKQEVVEQEVTAVSFDNSGIASAVEVYNKDNAKDFALVKRETPTEGHSLTFIDQTLGNLGRFNKPGGSGTALPGHRSSGGGM